MYDSFDLPPAAPAPCVPAPCAPTPAINSEMAFIDSEGVYQECTVRSVLDGYAWVQKASGKLNTVPVSKLTSRKSERELFIEIAIEVVGDHYAGTGAILDGCISIAKMANAMYQAGYRKVVNNDS